MPVDQRRNQRTRSRSWASGAFFPAPNRSSSSGPTFANGRRHERRAPRSLADRPGGSLRPANRPADHVYSIRGAASSTGRGSIRRDWTWTDHCSSGSTRSFIWRSSRREQAWKRCADRPTSIARRVGVVFGNIVLPTETASALTREVFGPRF